MAPAWQQQTEGRWGNVAGRRSLKQLGNPTTCRTGKVRQAVHRGWQVPTAPRHPAAQESSGH